MIHPERLSMIEIELQARALRAQAARDLVRSFTTWLRGTPQPKPATRTV